MKNNKEIAELIISLLGLMFVGLKLCSVIDWSWWWVTLPFWWRAPIYLIGILIGFLFMFFKYVFKKGKAKTL
jgi:hypothetical protein